MILKNAIAVKRDIIILLEKFHVISNNDMISRSLL